MKQLYQPESGILTVKYRPDGEICEENPPRFSWLPANEENGPYLLELSRGEFGDGSLRWADIPLNFFAPDTTLEEGNWNWRYALQTPEGPLYSTVRSFTMPSSAPKTPLPAREARFSGTDAAHPRLWLGPDEVRSFRNFLKKDPDFCGFDRFFRHAVQPFLGTPFVKEPLPYPENKRVIALWRKSYQDCQTAYNRIRFLSVAGTILEDEKFLQQAVEETVALAGWDIHGPTGRDYNDECAFRVAGALAWGYDWLYHRFTDGQRERVRRALSLRTEEIVLHAVVASKIHYSLYDSHAVRSLSSVLMPCGIALLHEETKADQWLQYAVDYLNILYTPWGGKDGGWSEGGLYWTTGMAYLIEALNLLKNYSGLDLFRRPFFQHTGDFPLYCFPQDTCRASFGDQSNLGEKPILKTGFNMREFAGVTGNGLYQWYFERVAERESYDDDQFFNTGWWNFYFDEMVTLYNHPPVPAETPASGRSVKWFRDIGWVALHRDLGDENNHICCLTKSSPYGSVSHSNGDQNSVLLFAFGEPLLIESGYYIGFNSSMHRRWRRETRSQNNLLIGGKGQYAGMDKTVQLSARGKVLSVEETPGYVRVREDATEAYLPNVPDLERCLREVYFVEDSYFVIVDRVRIKEPASVSFLLHSLWKPELSDQRLQITGTRAALNCEFAYVSSGTAGEDLTDEFAGVDPGELEGLEKQWHFALRTREARNHVLVTVLHPHRAGDYDTVETIRDDQGHDVYLYFTHNGKTFSLGIDGNERY